MSVNFSTRRKRLLRMNKKNRGKDIFPRMRQIRRSCRNAGSPYFLNYYLCSIDKTVMTIELIKQRWLGDVCRERSLPASMMGKRRYRIALLIIARKTASSYSNATTT